MFCLGGTVLLIVSKIQDSVLSCSLWKVCLNVLKKHKNSAFPRSLWKECLTN